MTVPAYLAPAYRAPGDDWSGRNALRFLVETDATPPVAIDITGWTASGTIAYRPAAAFGPLQTLPSPSVVQTMTGTIVDGPNGKFTLSLTKDKTLAYPRQDLSATTSLLIVRAMLTDTAGNLVTVGVQPLFTAP